MSPGEVGLTVVGVGIDHGLPARGSLVGISVRTTISQSREEGIADVP